MDMLQIYVVFSLKTIAYVQYFNKNGHAVKTCPFLSWNRFHIKDQSRQKVETWNKSLKKYYIGNQANKNT